MHGEKNVRRAIERYPKAALILSLLIECLGLALIFSDGFVFFSAAWILLDAFAGGQKPVALAKMICVILPVACMTAIITALSTPDGRLVLDGFVTAEGLELGFLTGLRLVMMALFARTCLLRFGIGPVLVQLSWIMFPLKLAQIGPRLASRTVLRSLVMIPQYVSQAFSILGIQTRRKGLPSVQQIKRLDSRRKILVTIVSLSIGCVLLVFKMSDALQ
ncbi:MAG TPA: hypothetical protein PLD82_03250 [Spirochaetota bacterium]|nr:hypothetical protein [Spirochaetota bacterium]HPH02240.1 hypothetical protein [Spirochaetota bacterium]